MYIKNAGLTPSQHDYPGAAIVLPPVQKPKDALLAVCDGCGAQIWIPGGFEGELVRLKNRTLCAKCLLVRKVILKDDLPASFFPTNAIG